jgi:hypothetical protein
MALAAAAKPLPLLSRRQCNEFGFDPAKYRRS